MSIIAVVLLAMAITAVILRPNPSGMGTHQQLGLPPAAQSCFLG